MRLDTKRPNATHIKALSVTCFAFLLAGCAGQQRPFPQAEPLRRDTDLNAVRVPCRAVPTEKDPKRVACAPEPYVSPLVWDGVDNSVFRPLSEAFAVEASREAINVNSLDETPDSAWFTNRDAARAFAPDTFRRGACSESQFLDAENASPGSLVIDKGKANGASLGFRVVVPGKGKYLFKTDIKTQPERPSAASVIGAAAYHAAGFNTSCEQVVFVRRSAFKLTPGLRYEDNTGVAKAFDEHALARVLDEATKQGDFVRLQASAWLPGELLGPFRYEGVRDDDPNDVIPHQDRRDLRGSRLLAAWLNHFDAREQNTMDTFIVQGAAGPHSRFGSVRHYFLDTSDSLGSEWAWDGVSRRLGRSYLLDWGDIASDFATLGLAVRPWERTQRAPGHEMFGYFDVDTFDPEGWKNEYPNPAFSRMTERDGAWMARILARFSEASVQSLAALGRFSNPEHTRYLASVLERRLKRLLERYLTRLSPLGDARVANGHLCATDFARLRQVRPDARFEYQARTGDGAALPVNSAEAGVVCVALPASRIAARHAPTNPRYIVVSITNGVARSPLLTHLYDLGAGAGYRLVGLERPESMP